MCVVQPERMQVATTMLSEAVKGISSVPTSLCSTIFKSIASFFIRTPSATVESSDTSSESIVLVDVYTKLIPPANTSTNNNNNNTQHTLTLTLTPPPSSQTSPTQHRHTIQHSTTTILNSQSSLSLYFTTQPSSTFSFYSCSSCSSPFMPSACSSCSTSCASTIAPLSFIVSPTTFNNSSAGHFLPLYINVNADDSRVYRRLLVQLEETERRFDDFWNTHLIRLKQCLDLRRFEQEFRELQVIENTNIILQFLFCLHCSRGLSNHLTLTKYEGPLALTKAATLKQ